MKIIILCIALLMPLLAAEIHNAARQGDLGVVKEIIEKDPAQVSLKDQRDCTPIHYASDRGYYNIVEYLLSKNADVSIKDVDGDTPLNWAVYAGRLEVVKLLIDSGADINVKNNSNTNPLYTAAARGHKEIAGLLLSKGCDVNADVKNGGIHLYDAAVLGIQKLVDVLIKNGTKVKIQTDDGNYLLIAAAKGGMLNLVNLLVEKGADINQSDKYTKTPIHMAAVSGNLEVVKYLKKNGADFKAETFTGKNAYHFAKENNHQKVADWFVSNGLKKSPYEFKLKGKYFGMKKPGLAPEIFAPGLVSTEQGFEFAGTFTPDGKEFFFTQRGFGWGQRVRYTKCVNDQWLEPDMAPFTYDAFEYEPHVSPKGKKVFYGSRRPLPGTNALSNNSEIWYCDKTTTGWSEPKFLDTTINNIRPMYVSVASNGTIYYTNNSKGGIYYSTLKNGKYSKPVRMSDSINYIYCAHPFIAPDESYLIFDGREARNYNEPTKMYISFKKKDGSWTKAINMGKDISVNNEMCGSVSPDGKCFFFSRNADIYWADAKIIDLLKKEAIKE